MSEDTIAALGKMGKYAKGEPVKIENCPQCNAKLEILATAESIILLRCKTCSFKKVLRAPISQVTAKEKALISRLDLPEKCARCSAPIKPVGVIMTDWPYVHTDIQLACTECKFAPLYGMALDKVAGMALYIYDSKPREALDIALRQTIPRCPYHKIPMLLTKIFGNRVFGPQEHIRIQYKCHKCYLTEHKNVDRNDLQ